MSLGIAYKSLTEVAVFQQLMELMEPKDRYNFVVAMNWLGEMEMTGRFALSLDDGDKTVVRYGDGKCTFAGAESYLESNALGAITYCDKRSVVQGKVHYLNHAGVVARDDRCLMPTGRVEMTLKDAYGRLIFIEDMNCRIDRWRLFGTSGRNPIAGKERVFPEVRENCNVNLIRDVVIYMYGYQPIPLSYPRGFVAVFFGYFKELPPMNNPEREDWRVTWLINVWERSPLTASIGDSFAMEKDPERGIDWVQFACQTHFCYPSVIAKPHVGLLDLVKRLEHERRVEIDNEYRGYGDSVRYVRETDDYLQVLITPGYHRPVSDSDYDE